MLAPTVKLNNGVEMPILGLGLYLSKDGEEINAVKWAAAAGYRHFDTAAFYNNEVGVGAALKEIGVPREQLFVTTKVWNTEQGYDTTLASFEKSRKELGLDYVDLYLIHWPGQDKERMLDTWRALEKLYDDKKVRAIGVSNFEQDHLNTLLANCRIKPAVNQVELHPLFQQKQLRAYCAEKGIAVTGWRPLGKGTLLTEPKIVALAKKNGRTPAQIILRWSTQLGVITIPKSVTKERIESNFAVFDFTLSEEDMQVMESLDEGKRFGGNPATFF